MFKQNLIQEPHKGEQPNNINSLFHLVQQQCCVERSNKDNLINFSIHLGICLPIGDPKRFNF
jgi:hypothetical protein